MMVIGMIFSGACGEGTLFPVVNPAARDSETGPRAEDTGTGSGNEPRATEPLSTEETDVDTIETDSIETDTGDTQVAGTDTTGAIETDGTDPVSTDGTDSVSTDGTDSVSTDGTDSVSTDGTDPVSTDGTDPVSTDSTDPVSTDGTDLPTTDGTDTAEPDGTETVDSEVEVPVCDCVPREECERLAFNIREDETCGDPGYVCCYGDCESVNDATCVEVGSADCYEMSWALHSIKVAHCDSPNKICCERFGPQCRWVGECRNDEPDGIERCISEGGTVGGGCPDRDICCVDVDDFWRFRRTKG
jgi:hypothetical protein